MNPLTLVKRIQNINAKEASLGISEDASWHAKYKDSAYVYVGGLPFDLTEGDLLAVFAQYGEIVDVNLVRDKGTGKSKGFAFVAYHDQRSTNLAVDNLNGAQILGRTIRVDHVTKYKKMEEEDDETRLKKREERGVCRAFQRGECARGAACKFSHDEQRAANTGWGDNDKEARWGHGKFDDPKKGERRPGNIPVPPRRGSERAVHEGDRDSLSREKASEAFERGPKPSRLGSQSDDYGSKARDRDSRERSPKRHSSGGYAHKPKYSDDDDVTLKSKDAGLDRRAERRSRKRDDADSVPRTRDLDGREERRPRIHGDGYGFERKSGEEVNIGAGRKNRRSDSEFEPRRDREKSRRYDNDDDDDDDIEPRAIDKRSSRHESRDGNGRSDERRSRMHKD